MLGHISSHRLTSFIEVTFRAPSGTESQHLTVRGIHVWMSPENLLEYVLLSPDEDGFEFVGKIVLGSAFDNVVRQVDDAGGYARSSASVMPQASSGTQISSGPNSFWNSDTTFLSV